MELKNNELKVFYSGGLNRELDDAIESALKPFKYKRWASGMDLNTDVREIAFDLECEVKPEKKKTDQELTWEDFKHASPDEVQDLLSLVLREFPSIDAIKTWSAFMVGRAVHWASATHLKASDHDDVTVPKRPEFL